MKLSVITINYNNSSGLQKTLDSVVKQSFNNFEYIVIDGGSTDGSVALLKQYAGNIACWTSEKDNGIYDAMNKGIKRAKGNYIMFLNSGDYLINSDILLLFDKITGTENADIYYGDIEFENSKREKIIEKQAPVIDLYFLERSSINHQASFIKTSLFSELGLYDTRYSMAADYAFYLKAYVDGKKYHYMNQVLVHYPKDGISSNNFDKYLLQMKEVWKNTMPSYVNDLYNENKKYKLLLQNIIMKVAKKGNDKYQSFKSIFKR